jgi:hypothetical protein
MYLALDRLVRPLTKALKPMGSNKVHFNELVKVENLERLYFHKPAPA